VSSNRYAPRVAGFAFLFLIVTVLAGGVLWGGVRTTQGISDTLVSISENSENLRLSLVLSAVAGITTLVLAAMLYATVQHQDRNLAILALSCRAVEGGLYAVGMFDTLALLSLSQSSANDAPSVQVLADLLMNVRWMGTNIGAIFFAAGSTVYCYLLLKARSIPVALAAVGVLGSLLVLVAVPWQTALSHRTFAGASGLIWVPIGVFEITAGVWLLMKGAKMPASAPAENDAELV
jgi:Domain of unknown function (DUF4386)